MATPKHETLPHTISERLRTMANLMDSKQIVTFLGIGASTLRLWTAKAQIPHLRVGRHVRFDPVKIADWLEKRQVG